MIKQHVLKKKLTTFKETCKKIDLNLTHQRLEIYRLLLASEDHPSAETIFKRLQLKLPTISLDTVYRTLATLEKHGFVCRVETLESQARFEAKMEKHHHAVCAQCGKITDFQWNMFDKASLPDEISDWGAIGRRNVTLQGICRACAAVDKRRL